MVDMAPTRYMFQALVGALITGVTLVVTITQLVLSQELGPIGAQRERMSGSISFRGDVEDVFGPISPPEPESFLQALVDNTRQKADAFEQTVTDHPNSEITENVSQLTTDIAENADVVIDKLEDSQFGEFSVVKAVPVIYPAWPGCDFWWNFSFVLLEYCHWCDDHHRCNRDVYCLCSRQPAAIDTQILCTSRERAGRRGNYL
jgi:hypothetical protein